MPFKYSAIDRNKIVFTRLQAGCGQFAFISTGSFFTIIGVCLIAFGGGIEMPFGLIRFIVPAFGLGAVYTGIMLPKLQSRNIPDQIVFDNHTGRVTIIQQASDIMNAHMYYDEVEDFVVKPKKHSSGSGSSLRASQSYYTFHVYLLKKDGGQWELLSFNNEMDAIAEVVKLRLLVQLLQTPVRDDIALVRSNKFNIHTLHDRSELTWRNTLGYGPLVLFLFCTLFLTIGYIIVKSGFMEEDFPIFAYFVVGFIGLVFVIVIGGNILKMIRHAFTIYSVVVTSDRLEYLEKDNAGRIKNNRIFSATDIHAISFSFDTEATFRKIFIYTHDQFRQHKEMKVSFSVDSLRAMYNFYTGLLSLDLQDLTAVEALYVENYLQQQLRERCHVNVK